MSSIAESTRSQGFAPQRRGRLIRRAVPLAVIAAVAAVGVATSAPAKPAGAARTLRFTATTTSSAAPDKAFPQPGDTAVTTLRNTRAGRFIGTDLSACTVVTKAGVLQCTTTVGVDGGTFEVAFRESLASKNITTPIAGGTGAYVGARGYFALHKTGASSYRVVGHLK